MSGVWLFAAAAPCVMAAPQCPRMDGAPCDSPGMTTTPDCDTLQAVDCQRTDINLTERVALPDFSALPPRLLTVASFLLQSARNVPPADWRRFTLRPLSPPLYLQHAALLI